LLIVIAAALSALGAAQSTADTIYTYTGKPFTSAISPYTTNDFISGSFDLATPLGNNVPLTTITPTAFSFSDGVQTYLPTTVRFSFFTIQTDSAGIPSFWFISFFTSTSALTRNELIVAEDIVFFGTVENTFRLADTCRSGCFRNSAGHQPHKMREGTGFQLTPRALRSCLQQMLHSRPMIFQRR
jgi:hypothetical protein